MDPLQSTVHDEIDEIVQYPKSYTDECIDSGDIGNSEYERCSGKECDTGAIAIYECETLVCTRRECLVDDIDS